MCSKWLSVIRIWLYFLIFKIFLPAFQGRNTTCVKNHTAKFDERHLNKFPLILQCSWFNISQMLFKIRSNQFVEASYALHKTMPVKWLTDRRICTRKRQQCLCSVVQIKNNVFQLLNRQGCGRTILCISKLLRRIRRVVSFMYNSASWQYIIQCLMNCWDCCI